MDSARHNKVSQLFLAACELEGNKRSAFLQDHCEEDPTLRAEIEAMLAEDEKHSRFLEAPVITLPVHLNAISPDFSEATSTLPTPSQIGKFKILQRLGVGGMGIVYLAEQENPRRHVALKVIRPMIASASIYKRFEREAHFLGRLKHPGIAQVFEAGVATTDDGPLPYFAMEYIEGLPLLEYAESKSLGTRDRLKIIVTVCQAVQHAHEHGVIHRDLKPGNIMVESSGQPKILDFGVARATDCDIQATTIHTNVGQLIGTLSYMSPEQVAGDSTLLDTRSDIYALGVIGYQLLTNQFPLKLEDHAIHDAARIIQEDDPTPMSTINRVFRGDVETILLKALEKDRGRRYQTAADLAADITRYLNDEPISARPPSAVYQLRKFARRNRALVTAMAAIFVALIITVSVTGWGLVQANRQRRMAESNLVRATDAEQLAQQRLLETEAARAEESRLRKLSELRFEEADKARGAERDKRIKSVGHIKDSVLETFADQPKIQAELLYQIGAQQRRLGYLDNADPFLIDAVDIATKKFGMDNEETLQSLTELANLRADQAVAIGRDSQQAREKADTLHNEGIQLFRKVYELSVKTLGPEDSLTLSRRGDLATMLPASEAELLHMENLVTLRRIVGAEHPNTVSSLRNLAHTRWNLGRKQEAIAGFREVVDIRSATLLPEDDKLISSQHDLAQFLFEVGQFDEAIKLKRLSVTAIQNQSGEKDPFVLMQVQGLARRIYDAGQQIDDKSKSQQMIAEAGKLYEQVLTARREVLGSRHGNTLVTINNLARLRQYQGNYHAAEDLYKELIPSATAGLPEDHWHHALFKMNYGLFLVERDRFDEAEPLLLFSHKHLRRYKGDAFPRTKQALDRVILLYEKWGKPEKAIVYKASVDGTK